jgi:nucleotide-binding universal stress UspA family protein
MSNTRQIWRKILVPHDFSSSANHAAALARDEARAHDGGILLLHVVELPGYVGPDSTLVLPQGSDAPISMRQYAIQSATEHLEQLAHRLAADGVPVAALVRVGYPADEIMQLVQEQQVSSIVMGTHGRTGMARLMAGSVAEKVVRTSPVPVITIRHTD